MRGMADRSTGHKAGIRRGALAVLGASLMVIASAGLTSAHSNATFAARASVQPKIQYLDDTAGTVLTFTIHNTGNVGIGAVEIARPWNAWKVLACPAAPAGWTSQRTDWRCRYRSAATTADDLKPHTSSSAFRLTAGTAPGSKDLVGLWKVTVSRTDGLDHHAKRRWAAPEGSGLSTKIRTFQILDAFVVGSAPAPGSACPASTPANHSANVGATGQRIVICGRNRANVALTPVGSRSSLGGSFIASHGSFASGSIGANSSASVVLGTWSRVRITGSSGTAKTVVARIGAAWHRTSPVTTLTGYSTSGSVADDAPTMTTTSPADGADHVAVDTNIRFDFSEPVTASAGSFGLECPTGTPRTFTVGGSGTASITLAPTSVLPEGVACTVTAKAASISDADANDPPDHPTSDRTISFTTDTTPTVTDTPPNVTGTTPATGATGVAVGGNLTVSFSEPVTAGVGAFTIECPAPGNLRPFSVSGAGTSVIMLDPSASLPASTICTLTVIASQVSDVDGGDPPDHPVANHVVSFSTVDADAAPAMTTTTPADGAGGVDPDADIVIHFSEAVDVGTNSFAIECPGGQPFTVSGSGTSTITLDPVGPLPASETCTVTAVAANISDSDGADPPDHPAANADFSFSTVDAPPTNQGPTDLDLAPKGVDENEPAGTTVGTLATTDPDAGETFTYALAAGAGDTDNGSFQVSGDLVLTDATFDFETKASYSIRVSTTDSGNSTIERAFTITIGDANDAPVANPDSYGGAIGNTLAVLGTAGPTGEPHVVLTGMLLSGNDTDQDLPPDTLTVVAGTVTSAGGGTVTVNADGSFTFLPGVGDKDLDDTFDYQVSDGSATSTGTATIHIGTLVWYVDDVATGPHDGRSNSPFLDLVSLNGAGGAGDQDGPGDVIFIYQGDDSYAGGIPLEVDQSLLGERAGLSVDGYDLLMAAPDGPVITNVAGIGVQLADGVFVEGLDIAGTSGDGIFGGAISHATVAGTSAVDVSGAGGDGIELSGAATGDITLGASVMGSSGHSVVVTGRTGGTVAISGPIVDWGTGILARFQHRGHGQLHRRHHRQHRRGNSLPSDRWRHRQRHHIGQHAGDDHGDGAAHRRDGHRTGWGDLRVDRLRRRHQRHRPRRDRYRRGSDRHRDRRILHVDDADLQRRDHRGQHRRWDRPHEHHGSLIHVGPGAVQWRKRDPRDQRERPHRRR